MSIETAVVKLMSDNANINALVGSRIYPEFVPQGKPLPAITYHEISGIPDAHMTGASGLVQTRFQINGWCKTYSEARTLADYITDCLAPEADDDYPKTVDGIYISAVFLLNEMDSPAPYADNEEMRSYSKLLDFSVAYNK